MQARSLSCHSHIGPVHATGAAALWSEHPGMRGPSVLQSAAAMPALPAAVSHMHCASSPLLLVLTASALGSGGGVTQIVIPYITFGLANHHPLFTAWRFTFLIPATGHFIMAILILLFGQVGKQHIMLHAE